MSYGYIGATPSQKKPNTGVFQPNEVADLENSRIAKEILIAIFVPFMT